MRYRVVEKMNPLKSDSPALFYPVPVYTDTLELKDLLPEISNASSVTSGDVKAVVDSFVELLQRYLVRGNKIKIEIMKKRALEQRRANDKKLVLVREMNDKEAH